MPRTPSSRRKSFAPMLFGNSLRLKQERRPAASHRLGRSQTAIGVRGVWRLTQSANDNCRKCSLTTQLLPTSFRKTLTHFICDPYKNLRRDQDTLRAYFQYSKAHEKVERLPPASKVSLTHPNRKTGVPCFGPKRTVAKIEAKMGMSNDRRTQRKVNAAETFRSPAIADEKSHYK
jgi:hypothetical protein